jgi:hypothetical protein
MGDEMLADTGDGIWSVRQAAIDRLTKWPLKKKQVPKRICRDYAKRGESNYEFGVSGHQVIRQRKITRVTCSNSFYSTSNFLSIRNQGGLFFILMMNCAAIKS